MAGKWHAYSARDAVTVYELLEEQPWAFGTRHEALLFLRHRLQLDYTAAHEKVAELGRALANLLELEQAKP